MNILTKVQQWQEHRDAIPTEKIKVLGLVRPSVRRIPMDGYNCPPEIQPIDAPPGKRAERRINVSGTAMLIGRHGKLGVEKAAMQNLSSCGVRVISTSEWYADDTILVSLPVERFTSAARVAYCDALGGGRFAMGLEFIGSSNRLDLNALSPGTRISTHFLVIGCHGIGPFLPKLQAPACAGATDIVCAGRNLCLFDSKRSGNLPLQPAAALFAATR